MTLNVSAGVEVLLGAERPPESTVASEDMLFPWPTVAEASTFGMIWLTAVIGNGLITCTLLRRSLLTHPSNRLVFSVTLSNLIFSFCVFPCILVSSIKQQWIFGSIWCYVNAFFTILVTVASSATLAAIALDRYFAIVRPMQYSRKMTRSRANALLIFAWCLGLLCALPPCFGWSSYEYLEEERSCFLDWTSSISFSMVLLVITFCFPLVAMIFCYYAILQVARTKCKRVNIGTMSDPMTPLERIRALAAVDAAAAAGSTASGGITGTGSDLGSHVAISDSLTSIGLNNNPTSSGMNNNNNRSLRRNRFSISGRKPSFSWLSSTSSINSTAPVKGMRTIFLVLAAFLLTWIPMLILALLEMSLWLGGAGSMGGWTIPDWFHVFAMWSMCSGSVTYPILYGIYNRAIRKELRLCLTCSPKSWRSRRRRGSHFYNNSQSGGGSQHHQRRGSKWSTYSEYAALRPREASAAATAAAAAALAVAAPAVNGSSQKGIADSLSALGELARSGPPSGRKSSQDSGAVIPSDDEEVLTAGQRSRSHTSSNASQGPSAAQTQSSGHINPAAETAPPSPAAQESSPLTAAATWRALQQNRPRMALAVLVVSLQHIAAHHSGLITAARAAGDPSAAVEASEAVRTRRDSTTEADAPLLHQITALPADEGIDLRTAV